MNNNHREILTRNLVALTNDLEPEMIYDHLISEDIITFDDKERISRLPTRRGRASELISVIQCRGPNAFSVFVDSLERTHSHLNDLLLGSSGDKSTLFDSKFDELLYLINIFTNF